MTLFLATRTGLTILQRGNDRLRRAGHTLEGQFVTTVIAREGVILAGTTNGIFRSEDEGESWEEVSYGLVHRHVRWMTHNPDIPNREFAGTEPAAIYLSSDGGETWHACPEVEALRDEFKWWLPYSPEAGCVRGFAFHGSRAYAAVEVGAALRSDDGGGSWRLVGGSDGRPSFGRPAAGTLHPDVHSITVHTSSHDLVYAPTGGGFYRSFDGGETWQSAHSQCYVRAVWVDPNDPDHMILGPSANSSGRDGRIERTSDGGKKWEQVAGRWPRNMVDRFVQVSDSLFAIMAEGQLLYTNLSTLQWSEPLPEIQGVNDVASF